MGVPSGRLEIATKRARVEGGESQKGLGEKAVATPAAVATNCFVTVAAARFMCDAKFPCR